MLQNVVISIVSLFVCLFHIHLKLIKSWLNYSQTSHKHHISFEDVAYFVLGVRRWGAYLLDARAALIRQKKAFEILSTVLQ